MLSMSIIIFIILLSCQNGWSSLMLASRYGHVEVVDKLLQHGARVDLQSQVMTDLCMK